MTLTRRQASVAVAVALVIVLMGEKTPTALCGPPGDTGGGGWRVSTTR